MNKLTPENIKFIDNYLVKADVIYLDIRVEMIDHIATALESRMQTKNEDFYNAFKDYMVEHKKSLIKSDKKHRKSIRKDIIKQILKKTISIQAFLVFCIAFMTQLYLNNNHHFFEDNYFFSYYGLLMLGCFFATKYLNFFFSKPKIDYSLKYSAISIMASVLVISYYSLSILFRIVNRVFDKTVLIVFLSVFIVLLFNSFCVLNNYINKYKKQYYFL
ncbi:hypothetical protein [Aurantibacter aestuarii]|uniref:Uncharacterized protein n=1 Tax=Aurantibacter aestuarii TaxID=1266046 RepID=A0A2T1NCU4_9FLAO|nr:hypothetical protein [Aurantibacter aestuarii]PSG90239.1 hypothetical protein C7H52_02875 [Aurantibacter aestuarii]